MIKRFCIFLFLAIALLSCEAKGKTYRIGIDPSYFPAPLGGKEGNVYAFSRELLREISREEGVSFETIVVPWDALVDGLKKKKYDAMLSSISPRMSLQETYSFSKPFLSIGPVLVLKQEVLVTSPHSLKGKEISVGSRNQEALLIEKYSGVNVHYYDSIPDAFEEIITDQIDGILIDYLQAISYIQHLHREKIKIATPPLSDLGLRLLSLVGEQQDLLTAFNRGLSKLQDNGTYEKLLKKWELL